MTDTHSHQNDYSRYFSLKQKVYLINMSEERDREHFESLSGYIVDRRGNRIELQVPYTTGLDSPTTDDIAKVIYKLTTESLGVGIQMLAELIKVTGGTHFHLRLHGNLEVFQRRKTQRIDTSLNLFHIRQNFPLALYRKEFKRIMDYMKSQGIPPNLKLQATSVNLSVGGIRLGFDAQEQSSPLSMFFLEINDTLPPVCAVAEIAWERKEGELTVCGHRFIHILKSDQERINRHIQAIQKQLGITVASTKTNWELLDRMTFEGTDRK